jgi:hypothetical protein
MSIDLKSTATMIDELITTSMKCYAAQEPGNSRNLELAQTLNKRRNELIRALDERLGWEEETPTGKTY